MDEHCPPDPVGVLGPDDLINLYREIIAELSIHPCTEDIFDLIQTVQHEGMRGVIDQFAGEESEFIYRIKIGNVLSGKAAETNFNENNTFEFVTTLNQSYLNKATDVAIARMLMHEAIHAYIHSYLIGITNGSISASESVRNFPQMWDEMVAKKYGIAAINIERYHHEEMARNFVNTISDALKDIFGARFTDQFYRDLAWGSLTETDAFKYSNTLSQDDKDRIIELNYNEDNGNDKAEGKKC